MNSNIQVTLSASYTVNGPAIKKHLNDLKLSDIPENNRLAAIQLAFEMLANDANNVDAKIIKVKIDATQ